MQVFRAVVAGGAGSIGVGTRRGGVYQNPGGITDLAALAILLGIVYARHLQCIQPAGGKRRFAEAADRGGMRGARRARHELKDRAAIATVHAATGTQLVAGDNHTARQHRESLPRHGRQGSTLGDIDGIGHGTERTIQHGLLGDGKRIEDFVGAAIAALFGSQNRAPGGGANAIARGHAAQDGFHVAVAQPNTLHRRVVLAVGEQLPATFNTGD